MDRRKAMKIAAGAIAGGGAGIITLATAFKPEYQPETEPVKLEYKDSGSDWTYHSLDPALTAELAYKNYDKGSCMYAVFTSVMSQMAEKHGEPYASFPVHMMKYGHGGIGGYGTICGTLNAASALIGLFITDKAVQDTLIKGLFRWYEDSMLPEYKPQAAVLNFTPQLTASNSPLCHASNSRWCKETGFKVNSAERKERCRRLTGEVASRLAVVLNEYSGNSYITTGHDNETVRECMTCHGDKGKLVNTSSQMECTSCHTKSVAHKVFADIHYKVMEPR